MIHFRMRPSFYGSRVYPSFDEEPELRGRQLGRCLIDFYGQEDLCLAEIAKAEAGETVLDLYNQMVDVQLYPDGRVIIEDTRWSDDDEAELGPPARAEFTLAEFKQLILDGVAAKEQWHAQQEAAKAATASEPTPGSSAPGTSSATPTNLKAPN